VNVYTLVQVYTANIPALVVLIVTFTPPTVYFFYSRETAQSVAVRAAAVLFGVCFLCLAALITYTTQMARVSFPMVILHTAVGGLKGWLQLLLVLVHMLFTPHVVQRNTLYQNASPRGKRVFHFFRYALLLYLLFMMVLPFIL